MGLPKFGGPLRDRYCQERGFASAPSFYDSDIVSADSEYMGTVKCHKCKDHGVYYDRFTKSREACYCEASPKYRA